MKYLRNRLTVDDGTGGEDEGNKKSFDIPKAVETEDERKRRLYTEHHVVRSTGTFDIRYTRIRTKTKSNCRIEFLVVKMRPIYLLNRLKLFPKKNHRMSI